jgi:hypothetical protein
MMLQILADSWPWHIAGPTIGVGFDRSLPGSTLRTCGKWLWDYAWGYFIRDAWCFCIRTPQGQASSLNLFLSKGPSVTEHHVKQVGIPNRAR